MLFKLTFFCVLIVLGDYYLESPRNKKKTFNDRRPTPKICSRNRREVKPTTTLWLDPSRTLVVRIVGQPGER